MKILYISRNMNTYLGASYQIDFMNELCKLNNVIPYGPGYPNFLKKSLNDVLKSFSKQN